MPDFALPKYLEPPNEMERARIDEATAAAQQKAGTMIRRAIGMRRMQADAQAAVANGVDPITAKQNALFNNASLLFSDNPEAVSSLVNHQEANQVRERANIQLQQHRQITDLRLQAKDDEIARKNQAAEVLRQAGLISEDQLRQSKIENMGQQNMLNLYKAQLESQDKAAARELRSSLAEQKASQASPQERERDDLVKLRGEERTLKQQLAKPEDEYPGQANELKTKLEDVDTKLQAWEVQHNAREETVETTPQGGVKITRGGAAKVPGALTTAEQTNYGEDLMASANALTALGQLKSGVAKGGVVGPGASVKSLLFDKFLGSFDPSWEDPVRVKGRAQIGNTAQAIAGELGRKFRLSEPEMKRVEASLPSTGFFESTKRATDAIEALQRTLAEKSANAAIKLKRDVPMPTLRSLAEIDDEELTQDAEQGYLDPKIYWQVRRLKYPKAAPSAQPIR